MILELSDIKIILSDDKVIGLFSIIRKEMNIYGKLNLSYNGR